MQNQPLVTLPNYEIIKVVGSGSFGYVFEAWDHTNNRKVALKRVEKVGTQLSREYEILFELRDCDHVVKILDFYYSKTDNSKLIQNIVFEYMTDNLENRLQTYMKQKRLFTEYQVKTYIYQILKGLEFFHAKNIAHRDLKPENVLISEDDKLKICDFGSSKILDANGKNTPYIVSRYYRAPELILCVTKYTTAIDIWSTGCMLSELITRQPPFEGKSEGDQLFAIFKVLGSPTKEDYDDYGKIVPFDPKIFKEFKVYPKQDMRDKFYYIQDYDNLMDLYNRMLAYNPSKRITASEALNHPFFKDVRERGF